MSTAPVLTEAAFNALFQEVTSLLAKKLAPAKLKIDGPEGSKNAHVMNAWAIRQGIHRKFISMTPQAIANEFYLAVVADVQSEYPQLVWITPPKALVKRFEKQSEPAKFGDNRETSAFEQKVREGERAAAAQKLQDEAKRRCQQLVERFTPVNKRGLMFGFRDEHQAAWRKRISATKDFVKLERVIQDEQRKIYESLERASERI